MICPFDDVSLMNSHEIAVNKSDTPMKSLVM